MVPNCFDFFVSLLLLGNSLFQFSDVLPLLNTGPSRASLCGFGFLSAGDVVRIGLGSGLSEGPTVVVQCAAVLPASAMPVGAVP